MADVLTGCFRALPRLALVLEPGTMKIICIIMAGLVALLVSCKKEARVSGKPVSEWVERLEDYDFQTRGNAFIALQQLNAASLKTSRSELEKIAESRDDEAGRYAATLLGSNFGKGYPRWADCYLWALESNAMNRKAVRESYQENASVTAKTISAWIQKTANEISPYDKQPYKSQMEGDVTFAREFLEGLRREFPGLEIVHYGKH